MSVTPLSMMLTVKDDVERTVPPLSMRSTVAV